MIAVLDWELASIGDPMMDLAYACMIYHYPQEIEVIFPNHNNGMYIDLEFFPMLCTQVKSYVCDVVSECVHTGKAERFA